MSEQPPEAPSDRPYDWASDPDKGLEAGTGRDYGSGRERSRGMRVFGWIALLAGSDAAKGAEIVPAGLDFEGDPMGILKPMRRR